MGILLGIKVFEIIEGSGYINDYNINSIKIYSGDIVKGIKEGFYSESFEGKIKYVFIGSFLSINCSLFFFYNNIPSFLNFINKKKLKYFL